MTNLQWIAAIASPRDVALHPNFMGSENVTGASLVATLVVGRYEIFARIEESLDQRLEDPTDVQMVQATRKSMEIGSVLDGANELSDIATSPNTADVARAGAASVLASVAYCELDRHDQAMDLLGRSIALVEATNSRTSDSSIVRALLLQQLGLRESEVSIPYDEHIEQVLSVTSDLLEDGFSTFQTSHGVAWDSRETMARIVEMLRDSALKLRYAQKDPLADDSWQEIAKARPPLLLLTASRTADLGLGKNLERAFERETGSTSIHLIGRPQYGDHELFSAALEMELIGHPSCRARRLDLGMVRFLMPGEQDPTWLRQEGVRLLRHAEEYSRLTSAVNHLRASGPLGALRRDAQQIIQSRLRVGRLRRVELAVLAGSATLLSRDEAGGALDAVLSLLAEGRSISRDVGRRQTLEEAWMAGVELASVAAREPEFAEHLLLFVSEIETDELWDRRLARVVDRLEWESLGSAVRSEWRSWLDSPAAESFRSLAESIAENEVHVSKPLTADPSISDIAQEIDRVMTRATPFPSNLRGPAEDVVRRRLEVIRNEAHGGQHGWGGLSATDIAVAMALKAAFDSLWQDIVGILTDVRVARTETSTAFERIAREPSMVPEYVSLQLGKAADRILQIPGGPFEHSVQPYPAALRCFAALGLLGPDLLLAECAALASSSDRLARVEAARTVTTLARANDPPNWIVATGIQLSHDAEATVFAEAGRALALIADKRPEYFSLVLSRILHLLDKDGLLGPILTLRGISETSLMSNPEVLIKVSDIAHNHPAFIVRNEVARMRMKKDG